MAEYKALKVVLFAAMHVPEVLRCLPAGLTHEGRIPEGVELLLRDGCGLRLGL